MKIKSVAKGFTLIELLVVVLIIGILSAVALPMYRKAVEKSKVADALTTMQAVAKSEHGFYLAKNTYTKDFADLDISLIDKDGNKAEDSSFETINYTFTLQKNNIKAQRANGEYTLYKMYEYNEIFCLPTEHYICEQFTRVSKNVCENKIQGLWHNTSSSCYSSAEERCIEEYGDTEPQWFEDETNPSKSFCGYQNKSGTSNEKLTIGEGQKCVNTLWNAEGECRNVIVENGGICEDKGSYGCLFVTVNAGGKCISLGGDTCSRSTYDGGMATCKGSGYCALWSTFKNGAICVGNGQNNCISSSFKNGSICYSNAYNACGSYCLGCGADETKSSYDETSCCCGSYCPDYAPKCADIGVTCDPQYMK